MIASACTLIFLAFVWNDTEHRSSIAERTYDYKDCQSCNVAVVQIQNSGSKPIDYVAFCKPADPGVAEPTE